jgi:hypothetical protein
MKVFLTVDVELWPDRWDLSPNRLNEYFRRYILGHTASGAHGLPFQLELLREHGLQAVFFVEPLFSCEYGIGPLREIVAMVLDAGQEVQLHLHTEWVKHMTRSILPGRAGINIREFDEAEQVFLIGTGIEQMLRAGAPRPLAHRAGNFGANRTTLRALLRNAISFDSSYNYACALGPFVPDTLWQPRVLDGVREYPVSVYQGLPGRFRHAQIAGSSFLELAHAAKAAESAGWRTFTVFWHSVELLNPERTRPDRISIRRLERFCRFLADNREQFATVGFAHGADDSDLTGNGVAQPISTPTSYALMRYGEQIAQRWL